MNKATTLILVGILTLFVSAPVIAHVGSWGHMGNTWGHRYDSRWMHNDYDSGYGRGSGSCWNYTDSQNRRVEINSADKAKAEVEEYLKSSRNPYLKAGEVIEKEDVFEVAILTRDGSLADRVLVDKRTGRIFAAYQ